MKRYHYVFPRVEPGDCCMGLRPGSSVIRPGTLTSALSGIFHPALARIGDFRRRLARGLWPARFRDSGPLFPGGVLDRATLIKHRPESQYNPDQGVRHTVRSGRGQGCRIEKTVCSGSDNVDGPGRILPFVIRPPGNLGPPYGVIRTGARCVVRDGPEGRKGGENASRGDGFRGVFEGAENVLQRM